MLDGFAGLETSMLVSVLVVAVVVVISLSVMVNC